MAGTGEVWPHLLHLYPDIYSITAIDISRKMHDDAVRRLHLNRAHYIQHLAANALETDLPNASADVVISTFGLKTFNHTQQVSLAKQVSRLLKPGGCFALIEASDPKGWILRPVYRAYLDHALPQIERLFLNGARDFSMIGTYTRNFGSCDHFCKALSNEGLQVSKNKHFFGCATSVSGIKPK